MTNPQPGWEAPAPEPAPDPNQTAWQPPPPPPAKKSGASIVITLGAVLLLAIVGVVAFMGYKTFLAPDSDNSESGDKKETAKKGKLIAPEGEPFTVVLPSGMKQENTGDTKNAPAVKLTLTKPSGDNPEAAISAGTFPTLNGKDLDELSEEVSAQAKEDPKKVTVGNRQAISYTVTLGDTATPSASTNPTPTNSSATKPVPSASGDSGELRIVLVPMDDASVVSFNCSWDTANATAMQKACDDLIKSVKFTKPDAQKKPAPTDKPSNGPTGAPRTTTPAPTGAPRP